MVIEHTFVTTLEGQQALTLAAGFLAERGFAPAGGPAFTLEPQQSWRTETVSLKWERGGWKVLWFESTPGPTPPLDSATRSSPAELFAAVPQFSEFTRALP